jgi:hypothetical protein
MRSILTLLSMIMLAIGAGCGPTTETAVTNSPPAGPAECQANEDCAISCRIPNECCKQLCGPCEQAYPTEKAAELDDWRDKNCDLMKCPKARCRDREYDTYAACVTGKCVVKQKPIEKYREVYEEEE